MKRLFFALVCSILVFALGGINTALKAQPHLSIEQVRTCPGTEITVAIMAENLVNIGAITLEIGFDTNVMVYSGHTNTNPAFPGIMSNAVFSPVMQVNIAWSSLAGGNLASGKLMDLKFDFKNDSCNLTFNEGCELANVLSQVIAFTSDSGQVALLAPFITAQPANRITTEGEDAVFTVGVSGADQYHWQTAQSGTWVDLVGGVTYQNVTTSQLTVNEPSLALDNTWYRCFLSATAGCQQYSDSARLTVLPEMTGMLVLPDTAFCPETDVEIPLKAYALDEVSDFEIHLTYDPLVVDFLGLNDVDPLLTGITATVFSSPFPLILIKWTGTSVVNLPDGKLFDLQFEYHDGMSLLVFLDETYVHNAMLFSYNLIRENGVVDAHPVPVVFTQPLSASVMAGHTAQFTTIGIGASGYQWYVSDDTGNDWDFIANSAPYAGAQSNRLVISPTPLAFDGYLYRCRLSNQYCAVLTNDVQLSVDTNTTVAELQGRGALATLNVWQGNDGGVVVEVLPKATGQLSLELFDLTGRRVWQLETYLASTERQQFVAPSQNIAEGIYLCRMVYGVSAKNTAITRKVRVE